jgi:hypothetical protein
MTPFRNLTAPPSVVKAVDNGERIFGIQVPLKDQDLRTPTFNDAIDPATHRMNENIGSWVGREVHDI